MAKEHVEIAKQVHSGCRHKRHGLCTASWRWWPGSSDEAIRIISHWLDFYDPTLKLQLGPLAKKLAATPELSTAAAVPPQMQGTAD
jgi:hypothetical protein